MSITDSMREHALKKIEGLHLDYPRIIEAKVILDVFEKHRHYAEIILYCAGHITIEADTETGDVYSAIDETISKIARRMRKYKTRLLSKKHRPRKHESIRTIEEQVFRLGGLDEALGEVGAPSDDDHEEIEPVIVHQESFKLKPLYPDEAIMDLELSERPFVLFQNAKSGKLSVIFRRKDGDYGVIEPEIPGGS